MFSRVQRLLFNSFERFCMLRMTISIRARLLTISIAFMFVFVLLCCSALAAFGQVSGGAALPFLTFTPDARNMSMGRSGTGVRANSNAAFWNIATAAPMQGQSSDSTNPDNTHKHATLAVSMPFPVFTAGLLYGSYQGIDLLGGSVVVSAAYLSPFATIFQAPSLQTFNEYAISLGYARSVSDELSLGIQMSYAQSNLFSAQTRIPNSGRGFMVSFGGLYTPETIFGIPLNKRLSIGATLKNFGPSVTYNDFADPLPTQFRAGFSAEVLREGAHIIRLQGDCSTTILNRRPDGNFDTPPIVLISGWRNPLSFGIGGEYSLENRYFARLGFFNESRILLPSNPRLSVGAGVRVAMLVIDVAGDIPLNPSFSGNQGNTLALTVRMPFAAQ